MTDLCIMKRIYTIALCALMVVGLQAQERFGAAAVLGLTASQLDGDNSAGFNKLGITAGIKGMTYFTDRLELNVELLFSQRGSQNDLFGADADAFSINMNFLEIPVGLTFKDWLVDDGQDEYYKVEAQAGLSYARLISVTIEDPLGISSGAFEENFSDADLSWYFGGALNVNSSLAIVVRYTRSFGLAYEDINAIGDVIRMKSYFFTFRAEYRF